AQRTARGAKALSGQGSRNGRRPLHVARGDDGEEARMARRQRAMGRGNDLLLARMSAGSEPDLATGKPFAQRGQGRLVCWQRICGELQIAEALGPGCAEGG